VRVAFAVLADLTVRDALAPPADLRVLTAIGFRFDGAAAFFTGTGGGLRLAECLTAALTGCTFRAAGFAAFGATAFLAGAAATFFGLGGAGFLDLGVTVILTGR
jgi:hypothetical protein